MKGRTALVTGASRGISCVRLRRSREIDRVCSPELTTSQAGFWNGKPGARCGSTPLDAVECERMGKSVLIAKFQFLSMRFKERPTPQVQML